MTWACLVVWDHSALRTSFRRVPLKRSLYPFSKVYFDRSAGVQKCLAVQTDDISKVQQECYKADDEKRWLIALIADTGIRLGEGAGL